MLIYQKAWEKAMQEIDEEINNHLATKVKETKENIESQTPVKTGLLKSSYISSQDTKAKEAVILNDVEYAQEVNEGSWSTGSERYIERGVLLSLDKNTELSLPIYEGDL